MKHSSIKLETPCEIINVVPLNPLISKCQIKVCYIGQNRNGSVISKEVATDLANSLPGSPIVGFFNEGTGDFEEHNRILTLVGDTIKVDDPTRPYGFVDLGAQVWFQDYLDDGVVHTYLVTEGYIWTGQYPESKRILTKGNNQSMELDEKFLNGTWTIDDNTGMEFFIINDAIISKLCILGEDFEPCFEGATISRFSLDNDFNTRLFNLMKEVRMLKGGKQFMDVENIEVQEEVLEPAVEETVVEVEEAAPAVEEEPVVEFSAQEEAVADVESEPTFTLEDYEQLQNNYNDLNTRFAELQNNFDTLNAQYNELLAFKAGKDREAKQAMIDSFYMLSDEEKKDVQDNIDTYSLEDIEAKLAIICVHNKLDLSESKTSEEEINAETTFSLNDALSESEDIPALIAALRKAKTEN